jgi:hypothetical protein
MAVSGVAGLQVGRLAAVFYPLGHPMPYTMIPTMKTIINCRL